MKDFASTKTKNDFGFCSEEQIIVIPDGQSLFQSFIKKKSEQRGALLVILWDMSIPAP